MEEVKQVIWKISQNLTPHFGRIVFVALNIAFLCLSIGVGILTVFKSELLEKNFVRELIFITNVISSIAVILRFCKSQRKFQDFREVFSSKKKIEKQNVLQSLKSSKNHFIFAICMVFAVTPLLCDDYIGIWNAISHSVVLSLFSYFQISLALEKIRQKLATINSEILAIELTRGKYQRKFKENRNSYDLSEPIKKWTKGYDLIASEFYSVNDHYETSLIFTAFTTFLNILFSAYRCFVEIETLQKNVIMIGEQIVP